MAIIGLVLGILGLIPCLWGCFIFSIAAVVLGFLGKKETDSGQKKGGGMALAALITGVLGILASILIWILFATGAFDFYYNDI
ncbi:DUF4190 domain-containing protein [Nocardioides sp. TF02-7]|uniref:DUF4190 domain-containing protein n=1 Tax=Nocardioides sp. TF02-7 TaxID=2917724 RepID=UPI001F05C890|nr:DUF4190 domain-containing protein [Nocardioides sp. TF02-7]UMG92133.1 DUF4190 domain-containing protein [Nocardioides sp. TF02-7]